MCGRHALYRVCARPTRARTGAQQRPWREVHGGSTSGAAGVSGSVPICTEGAGAGARGEATDSRAEERVGRQRKRCHLWRTLKAMASLRDQLISTGRSERRSQRGVGRRSTRARSSASGATTHVTWTMLVSNRHPTEMYQVTTIMDSLGSRQLRAPVQPSAPIPHRSAASSQIQPICHPRSLIGPKCRIQSRSRRHSTRRSRVFPRRTTGARGVDLE
jgi:hypothetical protein